MSNNSITFSAFTKPWKTQSISEIGKLVSSLGFNGIEFSLRPGYQVEPDNAEKGLPELVKQMDYYGIKVTGVAGDTSEKIFAGCATAGIPVIRILANIDLKLGYWASEEKIKRQIEKILPLCEKYKVKVGVQNHYGPFISNSMELYHLLEGYNTEYVGAIWDSAQSTLAGEEPEQGLDIIWSKLCLINLKNVFYRRSNGPEAEKAKWERYFTTGRQGLASWPRIIEYLENRNYMGTIVLTHEYTDESQINRLLAEDIAYTKSLFKSL